MTIGKFYDCEICGAFTNTTPCPVCERIEQDRRNDLLKSAITETFGELKTVQFADTNVSIPEPEPRKDDGDFSNEGCKASDHDSNS